MSRIILNGVFLKQFSWQYKSGILQIRAKYQGNTNQGHCFTKTLKPVNCLLVHSLYTSKPLTIVIFFKT